MNAAPRFASPATQRECSSAWCSKVQASRRWYSSKASIWREREAALARGPEPHVHFVQAPRGRVHREQVREPLREPQEEHLVVDDLGPGGLPRSRAVVQEHEVEIRRIAEFHAAELAVARDPDPRQAGACRIGAARLAVQVHRVAPGERECLLDDQFGNVGQSVADLHERQASGEVQHRDAEGRGAAEMAQRVDPQLLVGSGVLEARREFLRELRTVRQRLEDARIEQLVEQ